MKILILATVAAAGLASPALADDALFQASKVGGGASEVVRKLTGANVPLTVAASIVPAGLASIPVAAASTDGGVNGSVAPTGSAVVASDAPAGGTASFGAPAAPLRVDDRVIIAPDPAPRAMFPAAAR